MREISVEDMKDYMIASSIFAQGQPEDFYKSLTLIEDLAKSGSKPKLVDPEEVPDDVLLCQVWQRAGGGYQYKSGELGEFLGPFAEAYNERDWSRYGNVLGKVIPELSKAVSEEIYGYMTFCTSPSQGIVPMYISALEGKPFIDGDCCGTAMQPHLDQVAGIKYRPIQVGLSPFGETVIVKDAPPMRARSLLDYFHIISGCWFIAWASGLATSKDYKKAMVKNQASRMMKIGAAVRKAREEGGDPVEAFIRTAPAYRLFEGTVESFTLQKAGGRAYGDFDIKGTGGFAGHKFRVWYHMENRISWLDSKPYVTIPDINGIVDRETCKCLSVLDHDHVKIVDGMYKGRDVIVLGIAADKIWYELEGAIEAVNAQMKAYGFDVKNRPIKEVVAG